MYKRKNKITMKTKNVRSIFLSVCVAMVLPFTSSFAQSDHHQEAREHSTHAEQDEPEFKDEKIGTAYQHYLHVKEALVSSDASEAQKGAEILVAALKDANATRAQKEADRIARTSALEKQREAFITLSEAMTDLVKMSISSGEVYKAYCPMANNNKGAYWLSNNQEIRNPYFGDKMLKCGTVKESL